MGEAIEELAHFIARTLWDAIPPAVREHAKLVVPQFGRSARAGPLQHALGLQLGGLLGPDAEPGVQHLRVVLAEERRR